MPLADIAARFGTPCFVYSRSALEAAFRGLRRARSPTCRISSATRVKANSNLAVLNLSRPPGQRLRHRLGRRARTRHRGRAATRRRSCSRASARPRRKWKRRSRRGSSASTSNRQPSSSVSTPSPGAWAASRRCRFASIPTSIRKTHPYISTGLKESKFGVAIADAPALYRRAGGLPHIAVRGIDCHIGSQVTDLSAYVEAAEKMFALVDRIEADGIALEHVDLGGGLGIRYRDERRSIPYEYARVAVRRAATRRHRLLFEPGRFLVGNAGVLLTRVFYLKPGDDTRLRDRRRGDERSDPARAVRRAGIPSTRCARATTRIAAGRSSARSAKARDFLAHDRELALAAGDLLAVRSAGAYGVRDELELQLAAARLRGARRRRNRCISSVAERRSRNSSRANHTLAVNARAHASRDRCAARKPNRDANAVFGSVRNRNTRECKARNRRRNLAIPTKMWLEFRQQVAMGLSRGHAVADTDRRNRRSLR